MDSAALSGPEHWRNIIEHHGKATQNERIPEKTPSKKTGAGKTAGS